MSAGTTSRRALVAPAATVWGMVRRFVNRSRANLARSCVVSQATPGGMVCSLQANQRTTPS